MNPERGRKREQDVAGSNPATWISEREPRKGTETLSHEFTGLDEVNKISEREPRKGTETTIGDFFILP